MTVTNLCQTLHCLPRSGGLYDQDPDDILMIQMVLTAQAEKDKLDADKAKAEAKFNKKGHRG